MYEEGLTYKGGEMKNVATLYRCLICVMVFLLGFGRIAFSSDSGDPKDALIDKLMTKVDKLEKKVDILENKLNLQESKPAPTAAVSDDVIQKKVDEALAKKGETSGGMISMPKITGFVDTTYNYNFNRPNSQLTKWGTQGGTATTGSNLSSYITKANTFTFDTAHVVLNGSLPEGAGYTIELDAGSDAAVNTSGGSGTADDFDIQEAYLTTPIMNTGVNLKVGKFVTLEGIEVIESPSDPTISRGHMFGMAEPFTHTGFLLSKALPIKGLELRAGLVNGWDLITDNNNGKTFLGGLGIDYGNLATGGLSVYYGPEQAANESNRRTSIDLTVFNKSIPKLNLGLQGNWGREEGVGFLGKVDYWYGFGIQPVYQFTDKLSLGGRAELMENKFGSRFLNRGGKDWNFTITPTYKLNASTTVRLEYRYDIANNKFFEDDTGVFNKRDLSQVLTEFVYAF